MRWNYSFFTLNLITLSRFLSVFYFVHRGRKHICHFVNFVTQSSSPIGECSVLLCQVLNFILKEKAEIFLKTRLNVYPRSHFCSQMMKLEINHCCCDHMQFYSCCKQCFQRHSGEKKNTTNLYLCLL